MNGESSDIIHSMVQFQRMVHKLQLGMKTDEGGDVIQRTMHFHPGSRSVLASAPNQQWLTNEEAHIGITQTSIHPTLQTPGTPNRVA